MKRQFKTLFIAVTVTLCISLGAHPSLADDILVSSDITTSELWSSDNAYILDGIIFVTDGATLTIEPGTVIRGMPDSETT
ncbi:MAG: hypothetical protein JW896_12450, partial [Deltaproteobacteria bacterium]|nr:hypothetical protein [Deltaproteobacteria bacterium]